MSWGMCKVSHKSQKLRPTRFYQSVPEPLSYFDSKLKNLNMFSQFPYKETISYILSLNWHFLYFFFQNDHFNENQVTKTMYTVDIPQIYLLTQ